VSYGVKPTDYPTVAGALIATLEKGLGEDFTPAVRAAWLECIHKVSGEMLSAS
jgi:nitric oxide dioxygenase